MGLALHNEAPPAQSIVVPHATLAEIGGAIRGAECYHAKGAAFSTPHRNQRDSLGR